MAKITASCFMLMLMLGLLRSGVCVMLVNMSCMREAFCKDALPVASSNVHTLLVDGAVDEH
jgi:hypothetical protein